MFGLGTVDADTPVALPPAFSHSPFDSRVTRVPATDTLSEPLLGGRAKPERGFSALWTHSKPSRKSQAPTGVAEDIYNIRVDDDEAL